MDNPNRIVDEHLFNNLSGNFFKYLLESFTNSNPKDNRAGNMVMLLAVAILAYAGVEAVKLIFRSNFGAKGVSLTRLVLSVVAFLALSGVSFYFYSNYDDSPITWASKGSFFYTSIFYVSISAFIIYKGTVKAKNQQVNPNYRGDSTVLGFLLKSWKQSRIQNFAEPLLCLALGVYLAPYNMLLGIPLIFCAISAWLHLAVESAVSNLGLLRDYLTDRDSPRNRQKSFMTASN